MSEKFEVGNIEVETLKLNSGRGLPDQNGADSGSSVVDEGDGGFVVSD